MSTYDGEEYGGGREVLLGNEDAPSESQDQQLAVAWAHLAGPVAPTESVTADSVLVVRPVTVRGDSD